MDSDQLKERTKQFALKTIKFFQSLPKTDEARIIGKQLLRSASFTAANYRAVCRARSNQEFYAKLCIVVEECDEAVFWLELLSESQIIKSEKTAELIKEGEELLYIFSASKKTIKLKL